MTRLTIICVDDEQTILQSLKIEIKRTFRDQYIIETADSAEEALELVQELLEDNYEIPLVISDYMMPHIKGDELLKSIHAVSPKTRKVMLTGQADIQAVANVVNYAKQQGLPIIAKAYIGDEDINKNASLQGKFGKPVFMEFYTEGAKDGIK